MAHRLSLVVSYVLVGCTSTPSTGGEGPRSGPGTRRPAKRSDGPREPGTLRGITAAHNEARAAVGVGPLQWSDDVARYAQRWANKLAARGCDLKHRRADRYGENLFWGSGAATATAVVDAWVAEKADYDPRKNQCKGTCGHYTQVVWAESRTLGCGMATCSTGEVWVCNYDPPGNFVGEKPF